MEKASSTAIAPRIEVMNKKTSSSKRQRTTAVRVSRNERRAIIADVDDAALSKRYRQTCDNKWEKY